MGKLFCLTKSEKNSQHLFFNKFSFLQVGFETDEDSSENPEQSTAAELPKTSGITREVKSDGEIDDEEDEDEDEEDEEEYESDIDELAEVVEQVTTSKTNVAPQAPKIVENLSKDSPKREVQQAPTPVSANHLSTFDRGLAKRQSKGKYQVRNSKKLEYCLFN